MSKGRRNKQNRQNKKAIHQKEFSTLIQMLIESNDIPPNPSPEMRQDLETKTKCLVVKGAKWHFKNGDLHREDGPAFSAPDGTEIWFQNDKEHRVDGPAIILKDGTEKWCLNGEVHREDGPAVRLPDGSQGWVRQGKFHREDGPAIIDADGTEHYYIYGKEVAPFTGIYQG